MRVQILKAFTIDGANGRTRYAKDQIVPSGQKNWIEKGLAVEVRDDADKVAPEPKAAPEPKSAD